jgi:phosphoribosylanthranilate isomerase
MAGAKRRTRIKICGITRPEDAEAAAEYGADAIGLIFVRTSRRKVNLAKAQKIVPVLPPWMSAVGVFVDENLVQIGRVVNAVGLTTVQMHGDEPPQSVNAVRLLRFLKFVKSFPGSDPDWPDAVRTFLSGLDDKRSLSAVLLDSTSAAQRGGTGATLDWSRLAEARASGRLDGLPPIILAGGLNPDNVATAVRLFRPWGVDVAGGVESAPGVKDRAKIKAFCRAVRAADAEVR